ncbi:hypothetical protein HDU98_006277 [Podochytrium sp. JEL0797]|nr:hypothetical protein HDU98_006277 [Podochytrium sp. JEL0797]
MELAQFGNQTATNDALYAFDTPADLIMFFPAVKSSFDCAMMMLLGMDELLKKNAQFSPQELAARNLSQHLNSSVFLDLEYDGLSSHPVALNRDGLISIFTASYYKGSVDSNLADHAPFFRIPFSQTDRHVTSMIDINGTLPVFFGGSSIPPPDSVAFFSFLVRFRNIKAIKTSSVPECLLILCGTAIVYAALPLYLNTVTKEKCVARIWFLLLGYACIVIPIAMKNVRLYIILKSKTRVDAGFLTMVVRGVIASGILVQVGLLAYWTANSNTGPNQLIVDGNTFAVCTSTDSGSNVSISLFTAYTSIIHISLVVLAYLLRDVDPLFNESPALLSIFALVGVLVAVMTILASSPKPSVDFLQCICVWLAATVTIVLLFGQKVYEVAFESLVEKGVLKMSLHSSGGKSTRSVAGVRSLNPKQSSKSSGGRGESAGGLSRVTPTSKTMLFVGSTKADAPKEQPLHQHRKCVCTQIAGAQVFKFKSTKSQLLWSAWNGGVFYLNHTRKRTWLSVASVGASHAFCVLSTARVEMIGGSNQVRITDFPAFGYSVLIEFKDTEGAVRFIEEFENVRAGMNSQK